MSWRSAHPLVANALDRLGTGAQHRAATRLVYRRDQPELHGPLRYGAPGRILAVR